MRLLVVALIGAVAIVIGGGSAAWAGNTHNAGGSSNSGGYTVQASVTFTGDVKGGGGTSTIGVAPTCYWSPDSQAGGTSYPGLNSSDPSTWLPWWDYASVNTNGTFAFARVYLGPRSAWVAAVERAKTTPLTAYHVVCQADAPKCSQGQFAGGPGVPVSANYGGCALHQLINFFPTGNPPPPLVSTLELAKQARERLDIVDPLIDRNPKMAGLGGATLVHLPTWFWVTNPQTAVGGPQGRRTVTASIGAVAATVVAKTDALLITSQAGGASCSPALASVTYTPGAADASGCTVPFTKASVGLAGGFPVTASTAWTARWTGTGGTGGTLDPLAFGTTVNVPVAESQAITTGTG